jgi:hypothetical protein
MMNEKKEFDRVDESPMCDLCRKIPNPYGLKRRNAWPSRNEPSKYKRKCLSDSSGVYFLFNHKGIIIYVGQAVCIRDRIACHLSDNPNKNSCVYNKDVKKAAYIIVKDAPLRSFLEVLYIFQLDPAYNQTPYQRRFYGEGGDRWFASGNIKTMKDIEKAGEIQAKEEIKEKEFTEKLFADARKKRQVIGGVWG